MHLPSTQVIESTRKNAEMAGENEDGNIEEK